MSRKTIVSLLAAGTLAIFTLAPTSASAFARLGGAAPNYRAIGDTTVTPYRISGRRTASFAQGNSAGHLCCVRPLDPGRRHVPQFAPGNPNVPLCWLTGCPRRPQHRRAYPTGPV
jgi:hypothetical protein